MMQSMSAGDMGAMPVSMLKSSLGFTSAPAASVASVARAAAVTPAPPAAPRGVVVPSAPRAVAKPRMITEEEAEEIKKAVARIDAIDAQMMARLVEFVRLQGFGVDPATNLNLETGLRSMPKYVSTALKLLGLNPRNQPFLVEQCLRILSVCAYLFNDGQPFATIKMQLVLCLGNVLANFRNVSVIAALALHILDVIGTQTVFNDLYDRMAQTPEAIRAGLLSRDQWMLLIQDTWAMNKSDDVIVTMCAQQVEASLALPCNGLKTIPGLCHTSYAALVCAGVMEHMHVHERAFNHTLEAFTPVFVPPFSSEEGAIELDWITCAGNVMDMIRDYFVKNTDGCFNKYLGVLVPRAISIVHFLVSVGDDGGRILKSFWSDVREFVHLASCGMVSFSSQCRELHDQLSSILMQ